MEHAQHLSGPAAIAGFKEAQVIILLYFYGSNIFEAQKQVDEGCFQSDAVYFMVIYTLCLLWDALVHP